MYISPLSALMYEFTDAQLEVLSRLSEMVLMITHHTKTMMIKREELTENLAIHSTFNLLIAQADFIACSLSDGLMSYTPTRH